jgi:hypothetical protein
MQRISAANPPDDFDCGSSVGLFSQVNPFSVGKPAVYSFWQQYILLDVL